MIALLLAIAAAQPAAAAAPSPPRAPGVELVSPLAIMLEAIVNPDDELVRPRMRAFVEGFREAMAAPDSAKLEREHPGISKAVADTITPLYEARIRAHLGSEHRRFARFIAAQFTDSETSELISLFSAAPRTSTIGLLGPTSPVNAGTSKSVAKFLSLLPELQRMQTEHYLSPDAAGEELMQQAMSKAVEAFLAAEPARATPPAR